MILSTQMLPREKSSIQDFLHEKLERPASELAARPKKEFRSQLVSMGYDLAHAFEILTTSTSDRNHLVLMGQIIEDIHTGSLIVDDIQDNSEVRRGGPCVHLQYGLPVALNSANWLYFKALQNIESLNLDIVQKVNLYQVFHRVLKDAHQGQAIDLGLDILSSPAEEIENICTYSLEHKSGCLTGLAMASGAILAGASEETQSKIYAVGKQLGILLQMFDDMGNLNTQSENPKSLEDLYLRRPSFVWSYLFTQCPSNLRVKFIQAVELLPDKNPLHNLLQQTKLKEQMLSHVDLQMQAFKQNLLALTNTPEVPPILKKIFHLGDQLYVAFK